MLFLTLSRNVRKTGRKKEIAVGVTKHYPLKERKEEQTQCLKGFRPQRKKLFL